MLFRIVNSAKTVGATFVSAINLPRLLHSRFYRNQISILTYHGVLRTQLPVTDWCFLDHSSFQRQIRYISENFSIVSLSAAINLLKNGAVDKPTVALTFDDGYWNNFDVAFPVLQQYGIPATIFLTTGLVDSSDSVWFCNIIRALSCTLKQSIRWNDTDLDLSTPRSRAAASFILQTSLKQYPPAEIRSLVPRICEMLDVDPLTPVEPDSPFRMLCASSIITMLESGLVEFGAHTQTHAILSLLSPEDQWREISCSVAAVEHVTGQPCRFFAYPNGQVGDYDSKTIALLRKCGVLAAVTAVPGPNDSRTSLMELKRYGVDSKMGMPMFQLLVHHFTYHIRHRRNAPSTITRHGNGATIDFER